MSATLSVKIAANKVVFTEINMSNGNTRHVLSALGFSTDFENVGPIDGAEFHAACERFLNSEIANYLDCGIPVRVTREQGCATMIDCGVEEGYLTMRVLQMRGWANLAKTQGGQVYFA